MSRLLYYCNILYRIKVVHLRHISLWALNCPVLPFRKDCRMRVLLFICLFMIGLPVFGAVSVSCADTVAQPLRLPLENPYPDYPGWNTPRMIRLHLWGDKVVASRAYQITHASVPLIAGGLLVQAIGRNEFRSLRVEYVPKFRYVYDDYLQYSPAVVMLGLKAFGVKSRSSWGRMLVSDAFSVALMAGMVNAIKYTVKERRPDGSSRNSFPSGHTATVFMAATMLHKEYGCRSRWYSIGGYTVASFVGISRILNNRHWLSDVLAGAGIGILSTELGYFFSDLIFKDKGLKMNDDVPKEVADVPSFLGIYMGYLLNAGTPGIGSDLQLNLDMGARMGVEGAWFWNRFLGVGGLFSVSSLPAKIKGNSLLPVNSLSMMRGEIGPYFSYPLTRRWRPGAKLLLGVTGFQKSLIRETIVPEPVGFGLTTGISMSYLARRNLGVRLFCDYSYSDMPVSVQPSEAIGVTRSGSFYSDIHAFTVGTMVSILF